MRSTLVIVVLSLALASACSPSADGPRAPQVVSPATQGTTSAPSTSGLAAGGAAASPTSPSTPSPTATDVAVTSAGPFTLRSPDFVDGAAIPRAATCDGADTSPGLRWTGAPAGTASLVLTVTDPDARDFVHWIAFDMTGAPGQLAAGVAATAPAPRQGKNDFGHRGYGGPCPPSGQHHYRFTLSALDRPLGIGGTPSLATVQAAMKGHVLAQVTLVGTYQRS